MVVSKGMGKHDDRTAVPAVEAVVMPRAVNGEKRHVSRQSTP
jgi:hypothetical protein